MTSKIQDYAISSDGRSCALAAKTGSIDFLCWPRFDSDACISALLGDERRGHWRISPAGYISETTHCCREDTTTLETEHVTDTGRVRVTDLMLRNDGASSIIPIVEGLEGDVQMAQIDVFGELMESFDVLAKAGIERTPRGVEVETAIVEHLEKVWDKPSVNSTIASIERDLEGVLAPRKPPEPGGHDEGAFLACSCWLADCCKMQGRDDEAAALLERVIAISTDAALLSEEYAACSRSLTGNIPQALTQFGVINTTLSVSGPVIQRGGG